MDELEQRLRSTLTSMAEEVPPSHSAWDEHQRRLALKSRKQRFRPAVTAIVAAAAAVLIAVPIMVIQQATAPVQPGALPETTGPAGRTTSGQPLPDSGWGAKYVPRDGETVVIQPASLMTKQLADKKFLITWAYVIQTRRGERLMCLAQTPDGGVINGPDQLTFGEPDCTPVSQPKNGKYDWGRRQVPDKFLGDGTKGVWVYVMSRPAHKMMLRRVEDNDLLPATTKQFGQDVVLFGAYMNSARPPSAYSLYNDADEIFYSGT
ncbi:hypothetical protein ALI144C_43515 [Actinosynnema sp. ALI-1.44]|uniref:hypothetical protein n=1 Tax=Actinosynnema sp. ALI-1.44 TaxID=1933779 RepID=UPI00097C6528|nr:hypothetical protein [Actinosynnema sp. ALI-1.44]ONI72863.1 hypothetical protein ALI144C_43515 [Actinosynnema sp. ALI-1.44]